MEAYQRLLEILGEASDIGHAAAVLNWDETTYMPKEGAAARGTQLATLSRLAHERVTSPELGELLTKLEATLVKDAPDSVEAAVVRVARRQYDKYVKIPGKFAAALALQGSQTFQAWLAARQANDFKPFAEQLARMVEMQREQADYLGWQAERYDALLDLFEPGLATSAVVKVFDELKADIGALLDDIRPKLQTVSDACLHQPFADQKQWDFGLLAVRAIGFDFARGRQDRSEHPFTTAFSSNDVRITTRVEPNFFNAAFFGSIHEAGHGLYEQGIPEEWRRHSLGDAASFSLHESQSRLWENVVGRSLGFWKHFYPRLQAAFPEQLGSVSLDSFYRAINKVDPSLIRVEADEVTYNLHIFLRFELERRLLDGKLQVADLPEAWEEASQRYLGIRPDSPRTGVLQDVHWSQGLFGYFPSYTLGNVLSVQLYEAAVRDHPDIPDQIAHGQFETLLAWMRNHVHRHGSMFTGPELVKKATGRDLEAGPYLAYLRNKYSAIYGLG